MEPAEVPRAPGHFEWSGTPMKCDAPAHARDRDKPKVFTASTDTPVM